MVNYEVLIENKIINKRQFLLNYYPLINLNETDVIMLLLIENMLETNVLVTNRELEKRMSISIEKIDKTIKRLIEKNYLCFDNYSGSNNIDTSNVYQKIIEKLCENELKNEEKKAIKEEVNIIGVFEKELKRKLSPFEIETIREWVATFDEELIIYALRESVLNGVYNLKYIEKIITGQAKIING